MVAASLPAKIRGISCRNCGRAIKLSLAILSRETIIRAGRIKFWTGIAFKSLCCQMQGLP